MKILIVAALSLASTSAFAGGSDAKWDCGNGITAVAGKGEFGFHMGKPYDDTSYPNQGSLKWDLRASNKGTEIWLNGKACKRSN